MQLSRIDDAYRIDVPCKINLHLDVLNKRDDGYHNLDTVMLAIDLLDTLTWLPDYSGKLHLEIVFPDSEITGPEDQAWDIPCDERNLVFKAFQRFQEAHGLSDIGGFLKLTKRIPSQAGLGGGSADAAAVLALAHWIWTPKQSTQTIENIAQKLGSDLNFFLESHSTNNFWAARCVGRGERVQPIPVDIDAWFVIIHPPKGCATAAVFRGSVLNSQGGCKPDELLAALEKNNLPQLGRCLKNGLANSAESLNEWIPRARRWFDRYDHLGQTMSGSGSSIFCLCATGEQAEKIARDIREEYGVRAYAVKPWRQQSLPTQLRALS